MSSEQRYDYSYAQFVQDDLPSLDLFDDSTITSITDASSFNLQENCLANSQQGGPSFSDDADTPKQSRHFEMIGGTAGNFAPQPSASSAFTPLDLTATFGEAGQLVLGAGNLRSPDDELQTFDNATDHSPMGGSEAALPFLSSIYGVHPTDLATPNNNVAPKAHFDVPRIGPINVSFFF
jgi:hypothetical protein